MKSVRILAAGALGMGVLLSSSIVARAAECRFDRVLGVGGQGSLDAATGSGDVVIVPSDGSHVRVSGHVKSSSSWFGGGDQGEVQRICDHPPIEQNGNGVKVGHLPSDWQRHVSVDYRIELPRAFVVSAESGSGDVELHDIGGAVTGTTGSGNVKASNLGGGAKLQTGSGDIEAQGLAGYTVLGTGSGNITARFQQSGDVRATTGSGDIRLENVTGALTAHTASGGIQASGKPTSPWRVGTASGDVNLHFAQGAGFVLDADSASGDIKSSLPLMVQGSLGKHHQRGTVSGGGPEVRVETASGDIEIN